MNQQVRALMMHYTRSELIFRSCPLSTYYCCIMRSGLLFAHFDKSCFVGNKLSHSVHVPNWTRRTAEILCCTLGCFLGVGKWPKEAREIQGHFLYAHHKNQSGTFFSLSGKDCLHSCSRARIACHHGSRHATVPYCFPLETTKREYVDERITRMGQVGGNVSNKALCDSDCGFERPCAQETPTWHCDNQRCILSFIFGT